MKKLGKKNLEVLNTVEAYASQWEYDNCTYNGIYYCGYYDEPKRHKIDNDGAWLENFAYAN